MPNAKNLCGDTYCEKQPVLNGNVHERQHKRTEKEEERIPSAPTNTNSTRTAQPQQVSFLNKKRQGPHRAFNSKHHRRSRGNRTQGMRQRGGPLFSYAFRTNTTHEQCSTKTRVHLSAKLQDTLYLLSGIMAPW